MRIGALRKRVALHEPVCKPDGMGGYETVWEKRLEAWSEFLKPHFSNAEVQGAPATDITQGVRMRAFSQISVQRGWRVQYGKRRFDVIYVDDSTPRQWTLTLREVEK